jgi:ATP-binding cassette subfamily F protein 3
VRVLSGGEKSRLILAKLLINAPNFLLLDEPTTHLDVDAVDALVKALLDYQGTIVFISHDIHFVRSVANVVFEVKEGRVRKFPGEFDYYLEARKRLPQISGGGHGRSAQARTKAGDGDSSASDERAAREADERRRREHNASIKLQIEKLLRRKEALKLEHAAKTRTLSNPRDYHSDSMREDYRQRIKVIEALMLDVDAQVKKLKSGKL